MTAPPASPPLVLIADDDELFRTMLQNLLAPRYRVLTAANGAEALELARQARPQVILTDILMPRMTGVDLLRQLRNQQATHDIPVVVLLATATPADIRAVKSMGVAEVLPKEEVSRPRLMALMEKHLSATRSA